MVPQVDEPDRPRVAIDGVDDASQDRLKRLTREGMPEISDREIVGHPKLLCVGDHDLDVRASVLMPSGRQIGARDLGQGGGDLDADHAPEGALGRLVDDSALAASEVDEGVAIGDAQEAEGSGQRPPGRWHVGLSIGMVVLGLNGIPKVEPPLEDAKRQLLYANRELP